jgi:hypothetical protein
MKRPHRGRDAADLTQAELLMRGMVSSGLLLLVAAATERVFFGTGAFAQFAWHPFWIIVLLATLQNGAFVGVATVSMASLLLDWPPRPVGVDITAHYIDLAALPLQWLGVALVLGLSRQAQIREVARTWRDNRRLTEINHTLAAEIERVDAALHRAELVEVTRASARQDEFDLTGALARLATASPQSLEVDFQAACGALGADEATLLIAGKAGRFSGAPIEGLDPPLVWSHPLVMTMLTQQIDVPIQVDISGRRFVVQDVRSGSDAALAALVVCANQDGAMKACSVLAPLVRSALCRHAAYPDNAHPSLLSNLKMLEAEK